MPRLGVVPHALLHAVPFHALPLGTGQVLDSFEVCYAPSVAFFHRAPVPPITPDASALVLGTGGTDLPFVEREAQQVARHLPRATVRLGHLATASSFAAEAAGKAVVHVAGHGLYRSENPMFSALRTSDGWLSATDVLECDLDGALVVLSACESALGGGPSAPSEPAGLFRSFLGAGARALLGCLWTVSDEVTADFMNHWYAGLVAGTPPSAALRTVQLRMSAERPHPYFWAPFVLIGNAYGDRSVAPTGASPPAAKGDDR